MRCTHIKPYLQGKPTGKNNFLRISTTFYLIDKSFLKMKLKQVLTLCVLFCLGLGLVTCAQTQLQLQTDSSLIQDNVSRDNSLEIWWEQGLLPEENEAILQLVRQWEERSNVRVNLKLISQTQIAAELENAIKSGNVPDVAFPSNAGPGNLFPKWAWQGQLTDVTDILEPIQDSFIPIALLGVNYQNHISKQRSYYAVPLGLMTVNIHYWRNLLTEAGFKEADIPEDWQGFWAFWQQVQDRLHQQGREEIFGLGLPMSANGNDMKRAFLYFLDAHNVQILNENGELLLDRPENRQGLIDALAEYASFYQNGYVPPAATKWRDSGNNISFLEGQSLMVANGNLSIPLTQKLEDNPYNQRSKDIYYNKIVTRGWPHKPDGTSMTMLVGVKQAAIPASARHKENAKKFLSYFLQPENMSQWLEKTLKGRFVPPLSEMLNNPLWNNPKDPHFSAIVELQRGPTAPELQVFHPAYSLVNAQKIWQKALLSILQDGVSPQKAADRAIALIQDIFAQWN